MEKITYVLEHFGDVVGVIIAENEEQLISNLKNAVCDNIEPDNDNDVKIKIGDIGDWGECIDVFVEYYENNEVNFDNDFNLKKVVSYYTKN